MGLSGFEECQLIRRKGGIIVKSHHQPVLPKHSAIDGGDLGADAGFELPLVVLEGRLHVHLPFLPVKGEDHERLHVVADCALHETDANLLQM